MARDWMRLAMVLDLLEPFHEDLFNFCDRKFCPLLTDQFVVRRHFLLSVSILVYSGLTNRARLLGHFHSFWISSSTTPSWVWPWQPSQCHRFWSRRDRDEPDCFRLHELFQVVRLVMAIIGFDRGVRKALWHDSGRPSANGVWNMTNLVQSLNFPSSFYFSLVSLLLLLSSSWRDFVSTTHNMEHFSHIQDLLQTRPMIDILR